MSLLPFLASALLATAANAQDAAFAAGRFADDRVLVKFEPGTAAAARGEAHAAVGGRESRVIPGIDVSVVKVAPGGVGRAIDVYSRNPNVIYAERSYQRLLYRPVTIEGAEPGLGIANNFDEQWNLHNTGQAFGATLDPIFGTLVYPTYRAVAGADINAPEAWSITHGSAGVTIAVLDSGVACTHLDLAGKCVEEMNFVAEHGSTLEDVLGHGSHVAGIAAALTDNGVGIAGVARESSLAALKVCYEDTSLVIFGIIIGRCDDADVAEAIVHATGAGHEVINMSFAGPDPNATLEAAINDAWAAGVLLVAGAGNEYTDEKQYPAGYDNVIAVGATDYTDNLSGFSSFGDWVSVLAPGTALVSTVPGGLCGQPAGDPSDCYDTKSGTSMAAPQVAGVAALMIAHAPAAGNAAVRAAIESSADAGGALGQNMLAWSAHGRLDAAAALAAIDGGGAEPTSALVGSIALGTVNAGRGSKRATATVSVVDDLGNPLGGAVVAGDFSGSFNESGLSSDPSANDGSASLESQGTAKGSVSFMFCVTDIMFPSLPYGGVPGGDCATF